MSPQGGKYATSVCPLPGFAEVKVSMRPWIEQGFLDFTKLVGFRILAQNLAIHRRAHI